MEQVPISSSNLKPCPDCSHLVSLRADKCPQCGGPLWHKHKSVREAYSWKGLGVIDLLPGVRDLPYPARFVIAVILFGFLFLVILR